MLVHDELEEVVVPRIVSLEGEITKIEGGLSTAFASSCDGTARAGPI